MDALQRFANEHNRLFLFLYMLFIIVLFLITYFTSEYQKKNEINDTQIYPGIIIEMDNPDLAPLEIIVSRTKNMYSYRTLYGEPIVLGPDGMILTSTDSGKSWHEYCPFDSVEFSKLLR